MKALLSKGLLLFLFVSICLTGCKNAPTSAGPGVCVYYLNEAGSELIAEDVDVPNETHKKQIEFLIKQLLYPPAGKKSPLNDGTKLKSVTVSDEIVTVDFSKDFYGGKAIDKTLATVSVAKTLCSLDYIAGVQILVEGREILDSEGNPIGILRGSDIILRQDSTPAQSPDTSFKIYFSNEDSEFLVPERRIINISSGDMVEKLILAELLKGPKETGHFRTIPQEAKLLSIETKDGVCFVNFSKEFVEKFSGGTTEQQLTIYSIVNSLTELSTIDRVQFLIEGEKREEFHDMVLNEPMVPNKGLIKE